VELERAVDTFARLPILKKHVPVTVDAPQPDLIVGAIGSQIEFKAPYLDADLCVWDAAAIAGIEANQVRELSCAYRYVPTMDAGEFNGEAYDGRMTKIQGNHLALVEVGRAGSDVVVADSNPFTFKELTMKMTKTGRALFAALSGVSAVLAADSALPAIVGSADRRTFKKDEVKQKLMALDAGIDLSKLDNILDAILDVEQEPNAVEPAKPVAEDESPADKVRSMLAGKVDDDMIAAICALFEAPAAEDEKPEPGMKKEEVAAAMDSLRKDMREAEDARRDVRAVVGDVIGMDSAAEVYGFALDHLKVDRKDVEGAPALRALFKAASRATAAPAPRVAQDSASLERQFPGLARIRQA